MLCTGKLFREYIQGTPCRHRLEDTWGTGSAYEKFEVLEMTASLGLE